MNNKYIVYTPPLPPLSAVGGGLRGGLVRKRGGVGWGDTPMHTMTYYKMFPIFQIFLLFCLLYRFINY